MTTNIEEMGLSYSEKYIDYTTLSVVNWAKFFPVINVQAKQPLIFLAIRYWYAKVSYNNKVNDLIFDMRIDGIERNYIINHRTGFKSDVKSQQLLIKFLCPYSENDVRRYLWFNVLKQYDYTKICKDTQDVLINLLVSKK